MPAMAEPKKARGKAGRPKSASPKKQAVSLRGSDEWRDWLNKLAEHCSMPATVVVSQALKMYAKANEFADPMPPR